MAITSLPAAAALREKMLRKRLWVVITKAVARPEELSKLLEGTCSAKSGSRRMASCSERARCPIQTARRPVLV